MARRFSWCTVAALLLVLFVAAEGLRGQIPQPDSHKSDSGLSRGESKFNPKTTGDTADISTSAPLRVKSNRERGFQLRKSPVSKQLNEPTTLRTFTDSSTTERSKPRLWRTTERSGVPPRITAYSKPESSNTQANNDSRGRISGRQSPTESKVESSINGRNDRRHSSEDDPKKSKNNEHEVHSGRKKDRQISRRISTNEEDEKLDTSGPSVFTSSPHNSGSRTGRKIQMSHNGRELKKQLPASRRYTDSADQIVGTTTVAGRKRGEGRSGGRKTEKNKPKSNRSRANVKEVDNALNRRGPDLLSESESVRVDIPLAVGSAENPITTTFPSLTTLPASANSVDRSAVHRDNSRAVNRRSDLKEVARTNVKDTRGNADRPKSRGRSGDSEFNSTSSRSSRRGSSRFNDYSTTETIEQIAHPRSRNEGRNVNVRDRSKNSETKGKNLGSEARPRSRGRSLETTPRDVAGGVQETRRRQSSDRSSGDKRLRGADAKPRTPDNRVPDQDSRFRMRSRSRVETTTIPSPGITTTTTTTTTVIPETTLAEALTVATTESDMMITTTRSAPTLTTIRPTLTTSTTTETSTRGRGRGRGNSQGRALPKEDFFNQGLGFRARKVKTESSSIINESRRINRNETHTRGNSGSTLRRRPGHPDRAKSENTSPTPVISSEQTNEVIPSNEQITSTEVITKIESSTTTVRRGQKKQKSSEENSTLVETTSKATRRGNKIFDKAAKLGAGKTTPETVESDNYPPEFKARLSQLKTTTAKPVFSKGTSRASPEALNVEELVARRLRGNSEPVEFDVLDDLEVAASRNNFSALDDEAVTRHAKKTSAALFAERSRMKLELARRLIKPELNVEDNDLDANTSSSVSKGRSSEVASVEDVARVVKTTEERAMHAEGVSSAPGTKKGSKEREAEIITKAGLKKGRIISERMVTSISVEEGSQSATDATTKPYESSTSSTTAVPMEGITTTTFEQTTVSREKKPEEVTRVSLLSRGSRFSDKPNFGPTSKPKKPYNPTSRNSKQQIEELRGRFVSQESSTKKPKSGFRPRYSKRVKQTSLEVNNEVEHQSRTTPATSTITSRYARKKAQAFKLSDSKSKNSSSEISETSTKRREFRPRTATYRRHSEVPTTLTESTTKVDGTGVAITPRSPRYSASLKTSTTPQSTAQEPQVSLQVSNETNAQQGSGITDSSNGDSGTNIFNPTRSAFLSGNTTLLDQLRSTVAPLLSSLGNRSPIFAGAYSNVNGNTAPRITPNGSPPRFSARYKGAELFVRKPNIYQPTVPSITSSSTTPFTPVENSGSAPPIDISSPGEPRFLTFYQAVESASVRNEQLQGGSQNELRVAQVESNATGSGSPNNDTTSPTIAIAPSAASSQIPDTIVITNQSDSTLTPGLSGDTEKTNPTVVTTIAPPDLQNTSDTSVETTTVPIGLPEEVQIDMRIGENQIPSVDMTTVSGPDTMSTVDAQMTFTTVPPTTLINLRSEILRNDLENDISSNLVATTAEEEGMTEVSRTTTPLSTTVPSTFQPFDGKIETTTIPGVTNSFTTADLTEGPESNAIEQLEGGSTEETISPMSTDAPTTETASGNIIGAQTTEVPITSTFRNRLIDFAQDILSRLQDSIGSTVLPTSGFTTTVPPPTEISNIIESSNSNSTLESLSQVKEVEATSSLINDATTVQSTVPDLREMTTIPSATLNRIDTRILLEETTTEQPASVGSSTDSSTEDRADFTVVPITSTPLDTQTIPNIGPTTMDAERDSEKLFDADATTQNVGNSGASVESLENSSPLPLDTEITTVSMATTQYTTLEADTRSSNDTLLTELMTIAKTLFSEAMNETQQLLDVQSTMDDPSDSAAVTSSAGLDTANNSTENELENEVDQDQFLNNVTQTTLIPEASVFPLDSENLTESNVETTTETVDLLTTTINPSENNLESDTSSPATTLSESVISESNTEPTLGYDDLEFTQSNETATTTIEPSSENLQTTTTTTYSVGTSNEVENSQLFSTTPPSTESNTDETTPSERSDLQSTQATVMPMGDSELTTNTYDLQSRNSLTTTETQTSPPRQTTETAVEQTTMLTSRTDEAQSVYTVNELTTMSVTAESVTVPVLTSTNQPSETVPPPTVGTDPQTTLPTHVNIATPLTTLPEMTTEASVNTITESEVASNDTTTQESTTVAATTESITEVAANVTDSIDITTNQAIESMTEVAPNTSFNSDVTRTDSPETTTPITTTVSSVSDSVNIVEIAETTNQPSLTTAREPSLDVVSNTETTIELTNMPDETTTSIPQTTPNPENETPTVVARFQDATSTTAQGTAGSGLAQSVQTTETSIPTMFQPLFIPETTVPPTTSSPPLPINDATMMTETTTPTITTGRLDERISTMGQATTESSGMDVFTVTAVSVTTTAQPEMTSANVDENLVSSETPMDVSTTTPNFGMEQEANTTEPTSSTLESSTNMTTPMTNMSDSIPSTTPTPVTPSSVPSSPMTTTPYVGRFGGSRITPAPRFSQSSTTKAPLRDYLIYGIYPNKTIVRKRPEDNLIDARNVDSPYVIFGIYPDGRLVRKFPNGTIIPDPPRSPVEVVFTLSTTTTTNRPLPRPYYNQANQGTYNQYQAPTYYSNPRPAVELMRNVQTPGNIDLGLTDNAIVGSNGGGPDNSGPLGTPASLPSTGKMSDVRSGEITSTSTSGPMRADSQGGRGRVLVDRERDEATRTKEAGGQRSSVYIGQDKFVNYWTNGQPDTNPRVLSVKINSVAGAANEGPATSSPSVPSFPNLNSESGGQVTAPPGFPWRDPLDQILGITTNPPVITASVASNTLDDSSDSNVPISARPVSPFVEVFSPVSGTVPNSRIIQSVSTPSTNLVGNVQSTTMATTMPSAISSIGSSEPGAITTMGPPATSSSTPVVTANPVAADVSSQTTGTPTSTASFEASTIGGPAPASFDVANSLLMNMQKQNAFGSTFDDLAFLNSLLQVPNAGGSTPKTLTEVEQLLANKILSLALNNPGLNRPSKAIQFDGPLANSFGGPSSHKPSSSDPIIIDLLPSSTATSPTWKPPTVTQEPHQKLVESTLAPDRVTWKPVPSSTPAPKRDTDSSTPVSTTSKTSQATTRVPVVITSKPATTARPRTTTAAPFSFGAGLWQALFGGNLFASPTTPRPSRQNLKQTAINPKHVQITPKPISTSQSPTTQRSTTPSTTTTTQTAVVTSTTVPTTQTTLRTVDISKIQVVTPNSVLAPGKGLATASSSISTTVQPIPINSKLDLSTSTFSPEADAKFLATLLRALQTSDTKSTAKSAARLSEEDELFLRALLAGQTTTTTSTTPSPEASNAALLAALLKAQGIEPPIPGVNIREQLQLASRGQSVTSAPRGSASGSGSTSTTTTRPFPVTTKKSATPRPTSRPRPRTTTWSPSSTYPPPLFSSFANYGTRSQQSTAAGDSGSGIFGATRSFSQFLGAALSGAAQQLQSFVRNGTRIVTEVVG